MIRYWGGGGFFFLGGGTAPAQKVTVFPGTAAGLSPGTTIPARLRGSTAATVIGFGHGLACMLLAQRRYRFRHGELLSAKAVYKAASAHTPAGFEAAGHAQQFAPAGNGGFALQHVTEDHPVAAQQHPAGRFQLGLTAFRLGAHRFQGSGCRVE